MCGGEDFYPEKKFPASLTVLSVHGGVNPHLHFPTGGVVLLLGYE